MASKPVVPSNTMDWPLSRTPPHVVLDIQGGSWNASASGLDKAYVQRRLAEEVFLSIMDETQGETVADGLFDMCEVDVLLSE